MKFGAKLQTFMVPEWSDKYIRYKELSRLVKRASRLCSGKIPCVDDKEEHDRLTNMFNVDGQMQAQSDGDVCDGFQSATAQKHSIESRAQTHSPSQLAHLNDDCVIDMSIDEVEGSESTSAPFEPCSGPCGTTSTPLSKDSTDPTDAIRYVVDQFEKEGRAPPAKSAVSPDKVPHLQAVLRQLDRVSLSYAGGGTAPRRLNEGNNGAFTSSLTLTTACSGCQATPCSCYRYTPGAAEQAYAVPAQARNMPSDSAHRDTDLPRGNSEWRDLTARQMPENRTGTRPSWHGFWYRLVRGRYSRFNLRKYTRNTQEEALSIFNKVLRDDIRLVVIHYVTEMDYIKSLVRFLKADIARRGGNLDDSYAGLIRKACTAFWDSCDKLRLYLNLNTLAVYKLLKKKDKLLGTGDVFNLYPTYKSVMLSLDVSAGILDDVAQIYNSLMEQPHVDFGVLKSDMESTLNSLRPKPAHGLFYIYGLCTVLLLNSLFLCSFDFNMPFDLQILLSQIPAFRFFFAMSLIWWGFGWCQNYLESYGVNYQFQFGLSSNYSATEKDYYLVGGFQTLSSLALFVFFLLDCRLHLLPEHHLYFLYPIILILSHLVIVMWPNRNLKLKLRKRLLIAVLRVVGAPFGLGEKVTLADSIIADVMTSLTRPLRDLVFLITYFFIGVTSDHKVESPIVKTWIIPVVMCYPYFIRFSQCFRRYYNEKRWLHVGNMAKYISGISCVVVSSVYWETLFGMTVWQRRALVITFYVIATLFQCWWDFVIDWGLDVNWNIFKTRQNRLMYTRQSYYLAVLFNMVCRCTWALTTIPFSLISNEELSSDIVFLMASVIEIVRRVVWVTFRLESEHLLNSYKYRTALWVPKLYNCKNLIVKEMKMLNEQL
ncbi:G-protein associated signal transduction protein, putative [Babesia caballi]|uniref:G-protein associated signal transduction protein, putative n=1 Tax=Babesia caballi TaxID=5871 RepID=A0AAV4LUU9_BABCB|nr:G-protein associated signal transduction protein, putative [Babesia caballi]